jgi:pimeloyl-ACP methyl ester carboxylesterase
MIRNWGAVALVFALLSAGCNSSDEIRTVQSADGTPIVFEVRGRGPAVVLVHGWSCDRSYWKDQVALFSAAHTVVAIDLAGHGDSGTTRANWSMEAFGADVAAVVNDLGLQDAVLVGHSMGGNVVLEAARQLPGKVAGLVWVDTYKELGVPLSTEEIAGFMAPFQADFPAATRAFVRAVFGANADPAVVERVGADMATAPPAIALPAMKSTLEDEPRAIEVLEQLRLPVVAINPTVPASDRPSMERLGVRVVTVDDTGHFVMLEQPQEFNQRLREAVDTLQ